MVVDIYSTEKKYKTIYVDPPWEEKGGGKIKRGADRHYQLMTMKEIEALPIKRGIYGVLKLRKTTRKIGVRMNNCRNCLYEHSGENDCPCKCCDHFEKWVSKDQTAENTEIQQEEINHPDRYAGGKYECIEVMQDIFGIEAVKHFCMLNAFKYIWRAEKKNGVEDIKKAVWYLNKYIELESEGEKE